MALRLLQAALWRKRGMVALAVLAVAIGSSVAGALLHVSRDISRKLTRELRALGPNLVLLPANGGENPGFLDEASARERLRDAGVDAAALLFVSATVEGRRVQIVGADLAAARRLHPSWKIGAGNDSSLLGIRLARRLGVTDARALRATFEDAAGERSIERPAGVTLESGSSDDEAWWIPLADAQTLAGLPGRISLAQARLDEPDRATAVVARLERGRGARALVLHALSATEADLLDRTRRLMGYVTLGVLLAAGLCAFGTLTDLALERKREIALLKALGATPGEVVRQFTAESLAVGVMGGCLGWGMGLVASQVIGREVFHAPIAVHWDIFPVVLLMSVAVAMVAGAGPIRLALAVEPAPVLRGE